MTYGLILFNDDILKLLYQGLFESESGLMSLSHDFQPLFSVVFTVSKTRLSYVEFSLSRLDEGGRHNF